MVVIYWGDRLGCKLQIERSELLLGGFRSAIPRLGEPGGLAGADRPGCDRNRAGRSGDILLKPDPDLLKYLLSGALLVEVTMNQTFDVALKLIDAWVGIAPLIG